VLDGCADERSINASPQSRIMRIPATEGFDESGCRTRPSGGDRASGSGCQIS
jgi:hypothetical protein